MQSALLLQKYPPKVTFLSISTKYTRALHTYSPRGTTKGDPPQ